MIKLLLGSTIEIWGTKYINDPKIREQEDRDKEIDNQLRVAKAKLEALGVVTENLTIH